MNWWAPVWVVVMLLALGTGAGLIGLVVAWWHKRRPARGMLEWHAEVERRAVAVVQSDLQAAEAKAHLLELIGEMPKDFNPTVFLTVDLSAGFQRAAMHQAEQLGLVPRGTFARVYGAAGLALPSAPGEPQVEVTVADAGQAEAGRLVGTHWVSGK